MVLPHAILTSNIPTEIKVENAAQICRRSVTTSVEVGRKDNLE